MKKNLDLILSVVFTAIITCAATCYVFLVVLDKDDDPFFTTMKELQDVIDDNAIFEFDRAEAEKNAANGYLSALEDDYREFWTKEEFEAHESSNAGNFTGIGVSIQATEPIGDGIFVYRVLGNSPAEKAGILPGDLIVSLNGRSVAGRNYEEVYTEMGISEGETMTLTVQRDSGGGESLVKDISVTSQRFVQRYVDWRMIGTVGFIRIHSFVGNSAQEFEDALNALLEAGAKSFVFDLRNNLGGSLHSVEHILDLLVAKGEELVVLKFKDSEEIHHAKVDPKTTAPMVVLINGESASASELMASSLRDLNGSKLMGTRSFGKGIGQTTYRLSDGSAVKVTSFYYLTAGRNYYHGVGLAPDVEIALDDAQTKYFYSLNETNDPQLQGALEYLSGLAQ